MRSLSQEKEALVESNLELRARSRQDNDTIRDRDARLKKLTKDLERAKEAKEEISTNSLSRIAQLQAALDKAIRDKESLDEERNALRGSVEKLSATILSLERDRSPDQVKAAEQALGEVRERLLDSDRKLSMSTAVIVDL